MLERYDTDGDGEINWGERQRALAGLGGTTLSVIPPKPFQAVMGRKFIAEGPPRVPGKWGYAPPRTSISAAC